MTLTTRRFGEVWQFDSAYHGTVEQQTAVRDSLHPIHGTPHHRLLQRLDRQVNGGTAADGTLYHPRSALTIGFHDSMTSPGLSSPAGFNLSFAMGYTGCYEVARHEMGHIVDFWLLTGTDREWFRTIMGRDSWPGAWESWAEAVREWVGGGWADLTPILLPEAA